MYYQYKEYFQQLEQRMKQIEDENEKIKKENQQIKDMVKDIKPINIENINYKIQELVVKELKGTLNIGMTGITDPKELSKWIAQEDEEKQDNEGDNETEIHFGDIEHTNNDENSY